MIRLLAVILLSVALLVSGSGAQSPARVHYSMPQPCPPFVPSKAFADANNVWRQMLGAEEVGSRFDCYSLLQGLVSRDTTAQVFAVRALGRLERQELVSTLAPMLSATSPEVRGEAANAIGQAVQGASTADRPRAVGEVVRLLRARFEAEDNAAVQGIICETLGRLTYPDAAAVQAIEKLLVDATRARGGVDAGVHVDAPIAARLGAVKGLEALLRQHVRLFTPTDKTIARLRELSLTRVNAQGHSIAGNDEDLRRVRRLALLALAPHTAADEKTLESALRDDQWEVRRIAVRLAGAGLRAAAGSGKDARVGLIKSGLSDSDWHVRYEAVSAFARNQDAPDCAALLQASGDRNMQVALLAIDQLARCQGDQRASLTGFLGKLIRTLPAPKTNPPLAPGKAAAETAAPAPAWHQAAHAIVMLARVAPDQARVALARFLSSGISEVRMYAARAAAALKATDVLRKLAGDSNDNVRNAAISGLSDVEQHGADDIYIEQLARGDCQLLMTAGRALRGSKSPGAMPALLAALAAQTGLQSDTSRDARLALLERIGELGSRDHARALETYLNDLDPRVAASAAAILSKWIGTGQTAMPDRPKEETPVTLTLEEVQRLDGATVVVRMKSRGTFTLALLAWEAPVTAVGFARLVECGYYNGLTFHRVEPNFVVQGGSPGANEYAGYKWFMRDEVGLASNTRGTVGLSTRGRDTGDGQWYINLADNARLDHSYTVFATVVSGMNIVDSILEGDQIADIRIITRSKGSRRN